MRSLVLHQVGAHGSTAFADAAGQVRSVGGSELRLVSP